MMSQTISGSSVKSRTSFGRSVLCVLSLLGLCACDAGTQSKLAARIDAPPPKHPAMEAGVRVTPAATRPAMPANHPPVSGSPSASGTSSSRGAPGGPSRGAASGGGVAPKPGDDGRLRVGGVSFNLPSGWENQAPSGSMRLAQFGLPGDGAAQDGLMTVIMSGGDVKQNIERWRGQFSERPAGEVEQTEVAGLQVTTVTLQGTFAGMSSSGGTTAAKGDSMLLGAIVRSPGMTRSLFFKGVGPTATMKAHVDSFRSMVASLRED